MSLLDRLRILASYVRRGLRAECSNACGEGHTYRQPCAAARARSSQ